ncbi:MAG: transglycosylase SLT domain-containing protein [Chloroflexi bacterium]|nr:transglycosylase SLT domain-containing protein [Chloroflexota bacterium]MQC16919.1 hypothetical protein [Chloroflexota bacterium]
MRIAISFRRLSVALAAAGALLLVILGASQGVEILRDRGVLPLDAGAPLPSGLQVTMPNSDLPTNGRADGPAPADVPATGADAASGAQRAPGPDTTPPPMDPAIAPANSAAPGSPAVQGVLRIPDMRLTFGTLIAHTGGADSPFVYRAGVEARDRGDYRSAIDLFDAVATAGGILAPFATLRAAQMAATVEDSSDTSANATAAPRFRALIASDGPLQRLPLDLQAIALMEAARSLEGAGDPVAALDAVRRVDALPAGQGTRAAASWEQARIMEAAGMPEWNVPAIETLRSAPSSVAARSALDLLDARDEPYPALDGAFVAYRGFRNYDATSRYESLLNAGILSAEEAATAWFYLGALRERAFERESAMEAYAASITAAPDGPLAPDARYWRGRVLEELERPAAAATEYDLLAEQHPASRFVDDARLRAAVALGIAGRGAEATTRLAGITRTGSPAAAAEAAHWHAVLVALFDAPPADIARAVDYDPTSYAAAFEQSGISVTGPLPGVALQESPTEIAVDRAEINAWLDAAGRTRRAAEPLLQTADVLLAWSLAAAGEPAIARGLLQSVINQHRDEPHELVTLAIEARRHGLHDIAMRAAQAVLSPLSPREHLAAPRGLLGLAYPVPYLAATSSAADEFGIPVLLLYALMRQESAFHPQAGSSAGAFGLTQVIPPTGEYIADALGEAEWQFIDLARPEVSTRFGGYYLALQLDEFDGHMLAALAAYNGGPGNAARWLQSQPFAGPDGYLYAVDFTETRLYLELVSANYAIYRYLYLGLDTPRLPHG